MRCFAVCACVCLSLLGAQSAFSQAIVPVALHSFTGSDGSNPNGLIEAQDGYLYGTTSTGGSSNFGTVFRLSKDGKTMTVLKSFAGGTDGSSPTGLVQGADGNLYGTTAFGGSTTGLCFNSTGSTDIGCGTVFEISTSGSYSSLHSLNGVSEGAFPNSLIVGSNGTLYGSALACNNNNSTTCSAYPWTYGVLFSVAPGQNSSNIFQVLKNSVFSSQFYFPNSLLQGSDGNLYGTAQIGGNSTCLTLPGSGEPLGCGVVFEYVLATNTLSAVCSLTDNSPNIPNGPGTGGEGPIPDTRSAGVKPNVIIRQPGSGLPTGGNPWSLTSFPTTLTQGSSSKVTLYGTSTAAYVVGVNYVTNPVGQTIGTSTPSVPSTLFQCVPSTSPSPSAPPLTIYTFDKTGDGGGATTGLTLGSDGNLYGVGWNDVFQLTPSEISSASSGPLNSLDPSGNFYAAFSYGASNPILQSSMIQASNGNFYGTTTTYTGSGAVFEVAASPTLAAPVLLNLSKSQITLGSSVNLAWSVSNAFSMTAQQCDAFVQNGTAGAGTWTGLQTGFGSTSGYSGSATITPSQIGTFTYALTCGGTESGFATLTVSPVPVSITTTSLPNGTVGSTYTANLSATNGVAPYAWSLASGSLPTGLSLSASSGGISGTPTQSGTFAVSFKVTDSEGTPSTATANLSIVIAPVSLSITTTSLPGGTVGVSYTANLAATGGTTPYTWSVASGSSLPAGLSLAASTGAISGTPTQSGTFSVSFKVNDSESTPLTASATLSVVVAPQPSASVTANPTTITISAPGGSGSTALTFSNFTGASISVACTGLPTGAACNLSNASSTGAALQISTTAPTSGRLEKGRRQNATAYAILFPGMICVLFGVRLRKQLRILRLLVPLFVVSLLVGCSSGGSSGTTTGGNSTTGTPAATSNVTVTATSGAQSANLQLTLIVQ
jgi:uncharacterized repeat protein (TIGR03803 family)